MFALGGVLFVVGALFQARDARQPVAVELREAHAQLAFAPQPRHNSGLLRAPVELGRPAEALGELSADRSDDLSLYSTVLLISRFK